MPGRLDLFDRIGDGSLTMTSLNYDTAANSALRTPQSTNTALNQTQSRFSTGVKIG